MDTDRVLADMLALDQLTEEDRPFLLGFLMLEGGRGWVIRYPTWERAEQRPEDRATRLRQGLAFLQRWVEQFQQELDLLERQRRRADMDVEDVVKDL